MPVPLLLAGGALLGTGALGVGGARLLKEDLGFTAEDAAQQELQQGDRRGFNPKKGTINRSLIERTGDFFMGNKKEDILEATKSGHIKNLKNSEAGRQLQISRPNYQFTDSMTQQEVNKKYAETLRRDPLISKIFATNEVDGKYTREQLQGMDSDTLRGILKDAQIRERTTLDATNPATIRQIEATRKADERYIDSRNLQTALLANQMQQQNNQFTLQQDQLSLERRRMDMADRRADRRDRQAMIQQLMGGLSALGASIAI